MTCNDQTVKSLQNIKHPTTDVFSRSARLPITSDLSIETFRLYFSYQDGRPGCLH